MFFFFFFQAEDGIRDLYVTGVQTCALPIWTGEPSSTLQVLIDNAVAGEAPVDRDGAWELTVDLDQPGAHAISLQLLNENRSEERRVGKECRSRWSPYE